MTAIEHSVDIVKKFVTMAETLSTSIRDVASRQGDGASPDTRMNVHGPHVQAGYRGWMNVCLRPMVTGVAIFPIFFLSLVAAAQPATVDVSGALVRIDAVIAVLDKRIEDLRAQAEQMLGHADTAIDSDEQMRFEEMYGKLEAAAARLEDERNRLQSMRDELALADEG